MRTTWMLIGLTCSMMQGQSRPAAPSFEVVSVKPNLTNGPFVDHVPQRSGDRVTMHNCELSTIVAWAFGLTAPDYQLVRGRWQEELWKDYDIDAITPAGATEADLRVMFQSLLETRFNLKKHSETRQLTAFDLVSSPGKSRLLPSKPGARRTLGAGGSATWVEVGRDGTRLVGQGASMAELVVLLGAKLRAPVRDRTGITGAFDFSVAFASGPDSSDVPFLETAIHYLGLNLKKTTGKFEVWVVDNVDAPAPN